MLVFDLDNTLVNTREAHLRAYMSIGVVPPKDFHTRPWSEWCTQEDHDRKDSIVSVFLLEHSKPTELLTHLYDGELILSNTSQSSASVLTSLCYEVYGIRLNVVAGLTPLAKVEWLRNLAPKGLYIDDSLSTCRLIKRKTGWEAKHWAPKQPL